jgi:carbonic anhydrase
MAGTEQVTESGEALEVLAEGEEEEVAPPPQVIRVAGNSRLRGPLGMAIVAVPLLLVSFAGTMFAARSMAGPAAPPHPAHWEYEGALGPTHWGEIDPHATVCATGAEQSPVDITPAKLMQLDWLTPIMLKYRPSKASIVNNGHTAQVNYEQGSRMTFLNQEYELVQFHVHTPSEHLINGKPADMELHLVHATPDSLKRLAVLGILITEGAENPFFSKFWQQIPAKEGPPVKTDITINALDVVPRNTSYYFYDGSLTTPPCSEGVRWVLLKQAITASRDQIAKIKTLFGPNARPVQPLKDRFVKEEAPPAPPAGAAIPR